MSKQPVNSFVNKYIENKTCRFHMPGHKGIGPNGSEQYDITEIPGADSLYDASGIIRESERNASELFGAYSFYSAEGSSLCIRAMLFLLKKLYGDPLVIAGRNAHKAFLSGCALLDIDIEWLFPGSENSYLSCDIGVSAVEEALKANSDRKTAVYITSPDYLGNMADISAVSEVCKKHNALLLVDNAHGAYLKFLPESVHPIDMGADICCDSAHKTLPVLTGGAYLHISKNAPKMMSEQAKNAMSLFGSTSPSYLILRSLDAMNQKLFDGYGKKTADFSKTVGGLKKRLINRGYSLNGNEPLKIVINAKKYGYYGTELAGCLRSNNIECEFADRDFTVLMLSPENTGKELTLLENTLISLPKRAEIREKCPVLGRPERVFAPRKAVFSDSEIIPVSESEGRILAEFNISCPPAVPVLVCGERIGKTAIELFEYYGITSVSVIKEVNL